MRNYNKPPANLEELITSYWDISLQWNGKRAKKKWTVQGANRVLSTLRRHSGVPEKIRNAADALQKEIIKGNASPIEDTPAPALTSTDLFSLLNK